MRNRDLATWLHRLDSYTNAEFGRARTLATVAEICMACGSDVQDDGFGGLCQACAAKRRPDSTVIHMFRPMTRRART
jgi:hypothetical protein